MMDQIFSTRDIQNGQLAYRIEVQMIAPHRYMQRHIWLESNQYGPRVDEWIPSLKCCFDTVRMALESYEVSEVAA